MTAVVIDGATPGSEAASAAPLPHAPEVRRGALATFAGPSLPLAALGLPLVVYMPEFYARYIGLPLATVGFVFMLLRLLDLGVDPAVGAMIDNTRTRFGRYKPWLVGSAPLLMVGTFALFMARPGVGPIYLICWLALLYVGLSVGSLAQATWGAVLSKGYHERSRIYAWWQGANVVGLVLVLMLPAIVAAGHPTDPAAGVRSMGWFIMALLLPTFGLSVWRTPEPAPRVGGRTTPLSPLTYLRLMARPAMTRILIADFTLSMASGTTGALFLFFFRDARGFSAAQTNILLLIYFIGGLAGAPLWTRFAFRVGKHRALLATCVYYALSQSFVLVLPKGVVALAAPGMFIAGLAYAAPSILLRAMTADAGDEARLDNGEERLAVLYALLSSTSKAGLALAVGLTFPLLQFSGFSALAGTHNSPRALQGLTMIFLVAPVLLAAVAGWAAWGYKLDAGRHAVVRDALAEQDALPPLDPTALS